MHCNKAWSQRFLSAMLNQSFINGDFRKHRAKILREAQQSRLQDSVQAAQRQLEIEGLQTQIKEADDKILKLTRLLNQAKNDRYRLTTRRYALMHGMDVEGNKEDKKQFIVPCPAPDCRGFLSTQWKCGLCDLYACKHCFEVIGYTKDEPHECKPENIASAELIRKDTKPCPACGVRIHKLEGCDQMWCTECHVAFSWRTGKRTNANIHNPHYLEWQRKNEVNGAVRAIGDVACGGLVGHYAFNYGVIEPSVGTVVNSLGRLDLAPEHVDRILKIFNFQPRVLSIALRQMYRLANTVQNQNLPTLRRSVQELEDFEQLRVKYLLKRITMEQFEASISAQDLKRRKTVQVLHVMELMGTVLIETFSDMHMYCHEFKNKRIDEVECTHPSYLQIQQEGILDMIKKVKPKWFDNMASSIIPTLMACKSLERIESVINYCNAQLADISVAFNLTVPFVKMDGTLWRNPSKAIMNTVLKQTYQAWDDQLKIYEMSSRKFTKTVYKMLIESESSQLKNPTENIKL
tara:strand:+ start:1106 stop:2662 length:1557 start_codon:yes stop_codon:yes gene_type:complete